MFAILRKMGYPAFECVFVKSTENSHSITENLFDSASFLFHVNVLKYKTNEKRIQIPGFVNLWRTVSC